MERRRVLALTGGSLSLAIAGCVDALGGEDEGTDDGDAGDEDQDPADEETSDDTESAETEDGSDETTEVEEDSDDDEADPADELTDETFEFGDSFVATSQGGFIAFDEAESEAEAEGVPIPVAAAGDDPISIEADIADGTWEATDVQFPALEPVDGLEAEVAIPDGLSGEIDPEAGLFTIDGHFEITVTDEADFEFGFEATTGDSGALTGSFDTSTTPATITVVDNEFIVDDETGEGIIDTALPLPTTEEGANWIKITMHVDDPE